MDSTNNPCHLSDEVGRCLRNAYDHIQHHAYNDALSSIVEAQSLLSLAVPSPAPVSQAEPGGPWFWRSSSGGGDRVFTKDRDYSGHEICDILNNRSAPPAPASEAVKELVEALEPLRSKFRSGNDVPVERSVIRANEWAPVEAALAKHGPQAATPVVKESLTTGFDG